MTDVKSTRPRAAPRRVAPREDLTRGYAPPAGGYDEMLAPDRTVRPHYRALVEALQGMTPRRRAAHFASASQYLREAGVFYRVYGAGDTTRGWPLAHPPLVIDQPEWAALEAGLEQRAMFLEKLLADLYGDRTVVRDGVLPGAILGRNPEFLRPLADQGKSGKPLIRFIAVDLGRGPDGRWWVLGDRAQAPSGAGFALENRVATSRAFPELIRDMKVRRLASFFQRFRETLYGLDASRGARAGLLTPGPHNETYFEHAYLARYLGLTLLEGGDLAVHGASVEVRTVDGSRPIKVLWRRLDSDFADPLELFSRSRIGTPGLLRAVRAGNVELVNALGSGILETRALLAFQPALARALIGEPLQLPTVATWWCGQSGERDYVAANRERLSLSEAFPQASGAVQRRKPLDLGIRRAGPDHHLMEDLEGDGSRVVGQEIVSLSTAPVFVDGRLEPRPVTMRVFLARDAEGWRVMPGAFARVSSSSDPRALSMQDGGHSVDVWVQSGEFTERPVTLLTESNGDFARRLPSAPPARAADNLYWLGRYVERTEAATRLVRLRAARQAEGDSAGPLEARIAQLMARLGVKVGKDNDVSDGLLDLARRAFDIASRIRDRFSPDGWRVLWEIVDLIETERDSDEPGDTARLASGVLTRLSGFSGLVQENMYQFVGWRFLQAGRLLERGGNTARIASALIAPDAPEGSLEALLEFTDSRVTHRRRYSVDLTRETALDLTVLDPLNPRSVAYQVNALKEQLSELPGVHRGETLDMLERRIARLQVRLATGGPTEVDRAFLDRVAGDFATLSELLNERYFAAAPKPGADRLETE